MANSIFYAHNLGSPVKDFGEAVNSCGKFGGNLAKINSEKSASKALKIIAALNSTSFSEFESIGKENY